MMKVIRVQVIQRVILKVQAVKVKMMMMMMAQLKRSETSKLLRFLTTNKTILEPFENSNLVFY